ncbi:hypothetical protein F900_02868 [Acinetobacter modestus]|uniref:Uncharacterized protein n=1 Tax=Acinetobacter modestus TaxID=1776740 RepID=N9LRD5_9GAMM|nr:hypothetical protein [Acinetobacter modestus]ENW98783.1 hypothetical protein F900_02868 [Acinetobacter modestus]MCM1960252.1 hypothetical protein [Acinetobacter modestus]
MKAFFMLDELNQFHWTMLKSVLLILMLLPITEGALSLWQATEGSSQIMIGFFALSMLSAWFVLCFLSALKTSVWNNHELISKYEQLLFNAYRYIPMLFLSSLVAYLSVQVSMVL